MPWDPTEMDSHLDSYTDDRLATRADEIKRLRALVWIGWHEMNAIRARSGVPLDERGAKQGISEAYWSDAVDAMSGALGDDAKPWPADYMKPYLPK